MASTQKPDPKVYASASPVPPKSSSLNNVEIPVSEIFTTISVSLDTATEEINAPLNCKSENPSASKSPDIALQSNFDCNAPSSFRVPKPAPVKTNWEFTKSNSTLSSVTLGGTVSMLKLIAFVLFAFGKKLPDDIS